MKRARVAIVCVLALAGCSNGAPPAPATVQATHKTMPFAALKTLQANETLASYAGYGATRFGMDEDAFRDAWQTDLNGAVDLAGTCSLLQPMWNKQLADFDFMFEHGHFVRYDVGTPKEIAPGGGKVGMSTAQIQAFYGPHLQVLPHKYQMNAHYLRIEDGKGDVLLFETDADGKISRWRVGVPPQIDYEDGCL